MNGHLTEMIKLRNAVRLLNRLWARMRSAADCARMPCDAARVQAIAALPEALQHEARQADFSLLPIQRRVFTETAPIPDFQLKLQKPAGSE